MKSEDGWTIKYYIKAAKELGYSEAVIERLKKAKNESECVRITATAREEAIDRDRRSTHWPKKPKS